LEIVSLKDIARVGRLLSEFSAQLEEKFVEKRLMISIEAKRED